MLAASTCLPDGVSSTERQNLTSAGGGVKTLSFAKGEKTEPLEDGKDDTIQFLYIDVKYINYKHIPGISWYTFGARIAPQQQTWFCENFRGRNMGRAVFFRIVPDAMYYSHTISHGSFIPTCSKSISFYSLLAVHQCMVMILHNLALSTFTSQKTSTTPPDVNTIIAHQVSVGESYPVGLWVPTWVAGRMTSALLLG